MHTYSAKPYAQVGRPDHPRHEGTKIIHQQLESHKTLIHDNHWLWVGGFENNKQIHEVINHVYPFYKGCHVNMHVALARSN